MLCAADTVITVENPSFTRLLTQTQFDTIYHEHYSYLSAHAVAAIIALHGLELFRVEHLSTHGGSYRYWLAPRGSMPVEPSVQAVCQEEHQAGPVRDTHEGRQAVQTAGEQRQDENDEPGEQPQRGVLLAQTATTQELDDDPRINTPKRMVVTSIRTVANLPPGLLKPAWFLKFNERPVECVA